MTEVENTESSEQPPQPASRGIRMLGCDVRLSNISFPLDANGVPMGVSGDATLTLRTDMWRFWLREAIDAAIETAAVADQIPPLYERFEAGDATEEDLDELCIRELIASMRAISASAFAIDAFYAGVKARSPEHPDQQAWNRNGTARHKQVTETIFYHLGITKEDAKKQIRTWVSQIYDLRDSAVHPASEFREAIYRSDINVGVDQSFIKFSRENATKAPAAAIVTLDYFVSFMDKASKELADQKRGAREHLDELLDRYEAAEALPRIQRKEPKPEQGSE